MEEDELEFQLAGKSRKELQLLAKQHGIKVLGYSSRGRLHCVP